MSPEQALAFFLFAFVAAVTPGPSNVLLTATGANAGLQRGLPCLFGVVLGMGFMMAVVAFGLGSVVLDSPRVLEVLKWGGAAFLLWLAWKIASSNPSEAQSKQEPQNTKPIGFLGAASFQWVNPKSWLVCAGAAGTYLQADAAGALLQSLALGGVFILAALPSSFLWLVAGVALQQVLREPKRLRLFNIIMGGLLAGSVVFFIW
ncbi:LysE family translocator [Pelagibius sp. Alg239-R121]|uniref:LysE family translocator n=1 Tax=Pelagibius sp. Alg239-R121 TaxID=2993448 RepID=UPI0024A6973A|nr:LysE family translocator [Pelagibius sp. Alg239-R121]